MTAVVTPLAERRAALRLAAHAAPSTPALARLPHRRVRRKHMLFRAGQPATTLYLVHAGSFRTSVLDAQGRERVTGFALKGDVLGTEALDGMHYACDAMALDVGDVIELARADVLDPLRGLLPFVAAAMADALRRDWEWMLALHTHDAEQRVARFLLDHARRLSSLGFSDSRIVLRMTRADIGSFLDLASESVVRALTRLESAGLVQVSCRDIGIVDAAGLRRLLVPAAAAQGAIGIG